MNRRQFIKGLLAALLLAAVPLKQTLSRLAPRRVLTALRPRRYPGKVIVFSRRQINRRAKWQG